MRATWSNSLPLLLTLVMAAPATAAPHPAVTAQPRKDKWWRAEQQRINELVKRSRDARLLFIGDSITYGWKGSGEKVWQRYYACRQALNLGIGGDQTQHLLWRLDHGNLAGLKPKVAVLLIGVNNAFDRRHRPRQIAAGVSRILDTLGRRLPRTQVLLLGILPAGQRPGRFRDKLAATNRLLARVAAARKRVRYLDIGARFLDARGDLSAEIAVDHLHLTGKGYQIWARAIEPVLRRALQRCSGSSK